jgi:hypothetical protein
MLLPKKRMGLQLGALWMLTFCLGLFPNAQAQGTLTARKEFVNTYQWDVSLDLYQLFRNGGANMMLRSRLKGGLPFCTGRRYKSI